MFDPFNNSRVRKKCDTFPRYPNLQHEISRNVQCLHWVSCYKRKIEHGLSACAVDNPLVKARGLSLVDYFSEQADNLALSFTYFLKKKYMFNNLQEINT